MILVHELLAGSAAGRPDHTAFVDGGGSHSFSDVERASVRLASWLQRAGLGRGDRVLVVLESCAPLVVAVFATLRAGGVFVVVNPTTKRDKLEFLLDDSGARFVVAGTTVSAEVIAATERVPVEGVVWVGEAPEAGGLTYAGLVAADGQPLDDPGLIDEDLAGIIYTSGSTGEPKGVMLTHRNICHNAWSISTYLGLVPDDVVLCVLPLSFDYGLFQVFMGARVGFTVLLERSFAYPYAVLREMERHRATVLPGVPTIWAVLLAMAPLDGLDLSSVRLLTNTAAALPPAHIARLRALFPQARLFSMYGLTECTRVSYLDPNRLDDKVTSVGKAIPNTEAYVVDGEGRRAAPGVVGELVIRGASVMRGYWRRPEETARWLRPSEIPGELVLHSHDQFRADEEGFLYFVGRTDDILKTRGEKVSPREIEAVLCEREDVKEAAVVGVDDEIDGTAIKAIVVPRTPGGVDEATIRKHCRARLEAYMVPKFVEIRADLPKTPSGKIAKSELR